MSQPHIFHLTILTIRVYCFSTAALRGRYYNGPIVSDHSSKNYREHGKIQQESEKETTPYTPEYKAKLVIEVLQGEKELNTIAAENSISPNMLRNWKAEFLENAGRAFDGSRQAKEARRKEADLKKTQAQMLKTIGQLTLERDFLQDCFRAAGRPIPKLPSEDQ